MITTSAVDFPAAGTELACIRCGYCASACPAHLLPQQLLQFSRARELDLAQEHGLADCIECGACAYVCPSKIPLVQYYRATKEEIALEAVSLEASSHRQQRFQLWQYRQKKQREQKKEARQPTANADAQPNEAARNFSREQAREEIAAAVARVKTKRGNKTKQS